MQGCCGRHRSTSGSAAALVLMQAARLPPAPTRNAAEPTAPPNAAATSADTDESGRVCVGAVTSVRVRTTSRSSSGCGHYRIHHMHGGADHVSGLLVAALTASSHATRLLWQRRRRCCPCHAVALPAAALVWMQAARLSPGRTRNAAEPTTGPNAAATSADTPLRAPIQTKMVVSASVR